MTTLQSQTIEVPHLGGTDANYALSSSDPRSLQAPNAALTDKVNLLDIDVLGHGDTRTRSPQWTYWDTTMVNLQVLDRLGFVTVRMALLAPDIISGVVILGSSMDYESERTHKLGCWNADAALTMTVHALSTTEDTPDFRFEDSFCDFLIDTGFGKDISHKERVFWRSAIQKNWGGNDGRKRARMAAINLRDRDGLHARLVDVTCPVLWAHVFVNIPDARLHVVQNGQHYLNHSSSDEVNSQLLDFITRHE
ncbi:Alpha/Beta hydrolase protein [Delphinella strobiligena]|nr:Alpha/Beta hydrolase protein [Delphinella strobiligena]